LKRSLARPPPANCSSCAIAARTVIGSASFSSHGIDAGRIASRAVTLGRRTDVYVGCAPRTRRHGGRDAVEHALVLWADCDGADAVRVLERFEPQPSIVVASGAATGPSPR
jgi:hypothetical protein